MFITHTDARRFFEQRIVAQADAEDTPLSPDEQLMLKWSESEPDSVADPALAARLASIIFDDEYEQKIGKLLERSYAADLARDRTAKKKWAEAFGTLKRGDYYLVVVVERALGRQLAPWWKLRW